MTNKTEKCQQTQDDAELVKLQESFKEIFIRQEGITPEKAEKMAAIATNGHIKATKDLKETFTQMFQGQGLSLEKAEKMAECAVRGR